MKNHPQALPCIRALYPSKRLDHLISPWPSQKYFESGFGFLLAQRLCPLLLGSHTLLLTFPPGTSSLRRVRGARKSLDPERNTFPEGSGLPSCLSELFHHSLNASSEVPENETGASKRKFLSLSPMPDKFSYRCISVTNHSSRRAANGMGCLLSGTED